MSILWQILPNKPFSDISYQCQTSAGTKIYVSQWWFLTAILLIYRFQFGFLCPCLITFIFWFYWFLFPLYWFLFLLYWFLHILFCWFDRGLISIYLLLKILAQDNCTLRGCPQTTMKGIWFFWPPTWFIDTFYLTNGIFSML